MVVKGIKPRRIIAAKTKFRILKAMDRQADLVENAYKRITKTWSGDKPIFSIKTVIKGDDVIVPIVATGGFGAQKLVWLDDGTRKNYPIEAKKASSLAFQSGYKAKTKIRKIGSGSGGSFGPTVFRKKVIHPGIKAREFSLTIANKREPPYVKAISRAATTGIVKRVKKTTNGS